LRLPGVLRGAAGLLVLAGLVSLGTLFFPWTHYFYVGVSACPTCGLSQNVPVENFTHALTNGAYIPGLAVAALVYAGVPLAFALVGMSLLFARQPARVWWRVLLILTAVFFLGAVYLLEIGFGLQYVDDPVVTGDVGAVEWVALAAPAVVVLAGILLPGRRRARTESVT
jgi:hypothetical protein